jgi:hypothetical protein
MARMTTRTKALLLAMLTVAALTAAVAGASAGEYTGKPTVVPVKCEPTGGGVGVTRTCVATVVDESGEPNTPTGKVSFAGPSESAPAECALVAVNANSSSCSALVTPGAAGSYKFNVIYSGDVLHEGAAIEVSLVVGAAGSAPVSNSSLTWAAAPSSGTPATEGGLPTIKFGTKPAKKTHVRLAKFTFSSETAGATFQCRLGKGQYKACKSPYKHKVGPGKQFFSVRVVSGSGEFGADPLEYGWTVLAGHK